MALNGLTVDQLQASRRMHLDNARIARRERNALASALLELFANTSNRQDEPFIAYVRATAKNALAQTCFRREVEEEG